MYQLIDLSQFSINKTHLYELNCTQSYRFINRYELNYLMTLHLRLKLLT